MKEVSEDLNKQPGFKYLYSKSSFAPNAPLPDKSSIPNSIDFDAKVESCSLSREPESYTKSINATDPLLYIYTSGTTGLPKAVVIKHIRQLFACLASHYTIGLTEDDKIYCHLPLYHSSGGQVGTSSALFFGATTVIKKKFSASNFWKDCVKYDITVIE